MPTFCETCCSLMCVCDDPGELERGYARVEIDQFGVPIRILRKDLQWIGCPSSRLRMMTKAEAVKSIREQVFKRSGGECERCEKLITWFSMEMHEVIPKGRMGEVSLQNCKALCHRCHQGAPDSAHGNRRWHTSKIQQG